MLFLLHIIIECAKRIANGVVEEGLAACVNILRIEKSIYEWKGGVKEDGEYLLSVKAKKGNWKKLEEKIGGLHPYSIPEIVCLGALGVNMKYLDWVYGRKVEKD